jgi:hypothetical protein
MSGVWSGLVSGECLASLSCRRGGNPWRVDVSEGNIDCIIS